MLFEPSFQFPLRGSADEKHIRGTKTEPVRFHVCVHFHLVSRPFDDRLRIVAGIKYPGRDV